MKQSPKPFLPSKKEEIGCVWLFLGVLAIIIISSFAKVVAEVVPFVSATIAIFFLLFLWFYHKRKRQNQTPQKQKHKISTTHSQEEEYKHSVWEIYSKEWETANREKRVELKKRMRRWQELMQSGLTASQAYFKVMQEESDDTHQLFPTDKKTNTKASKMKILTVILTVAVIVLLIGFIPLKEVAYTATEPLSYQVTGFVEKERAEPGDPRDIKASVEFSKDLEDVTRALVESSRLASRLIPTAYVGVVNRDTISGTFTVHFTFNSSGKQYSKDVTLQLKPNELGEAKYQATLIDANKDKWSWEYRVTADIKTVTNYKKVTLLDYLLHY